MKAANRLINKRSSSNAFNEEDDRDGQSRDSRSRIRNPWWRVTSFSRCVAQASERARARARTHKLSRGDRDRIRLDAIVASRRVRTAQGPHMSRGHERRATHPYFPSGDKPLLNDVHASSCHPRTNRALHLTRFV